VQFAGLASTGTFCRERASTGIECRIESGCDGSSGQRNVQLLRDFPTIIVELSPTQAETESVWNDSVVSHPDSESRKLLAPCELNSH
jgi:hypothetical protein